MFNDIEISKWEQELKTKKQYKTEKKLKDPRMKKLNEYRHHGQTKWFYNHEHKFVRRTNPKGISKEDEDLFI